MLFTPLALRDVTLRNRIGVSPMCQYSSTDGFANEWHFVHLGAFAVGGAALVMTEATAISPEGRISPQDLGIWQDAHIDQLRRITQFVERQGAIPGMQLAHAGRKASTKRPWEGTGLVTDAEGGWPNEVVAPSAIPFADAFPTPRALTVVQMSQLTDAFVAATNRALDAGMRVIELHAAHGYLLHEFLSPISNQRTDQFGGSFDNRARFPLAVIAAVRSAWPAHLPLLVRISATDWADGGWTVDEAMKLAARLKEVGVDLIDCSSSGTVPAPHIPLGPGYQVPFAHRIRTDAAIPTGAVGLITDPEQAEQIVSAGDADLVFLGRELLRQPRWPLLAAHRLGVSIPWPPQYERARPR